MKQVAAALVLTIVCTSCASDSADAPPQDSAGASLGEAAAAGASIDAAAPAAAIDERASAPVIDDELTAVYQRFLDGLRTRDTVAYRELLTPEYIHVTGDTGSVTMGRSARMNWDQAQLSGITIFEALGCRTVTYGDAAVGPCWFREAGQNEGVEFDALGVSLTTFVRVDGAWRIAATRPSSAHAGPDEFRRE